MEENISDHLRQTLMSDDPVYIVRQLLDYSYLARPSVKNFIYVICGNVDLTLRLRLVSDSKYRPNCVMITLSSISSKLEVGKFPDLFKLLKHLLTSDCEIGILLRTKEYEEERIKRIDTIMNGRNIPGFQYMKLVMELKDKP